MHSLLNIIGTLVHRSFCLISDHTDHNVMMVYKIKQLFTEYLKVELPHIKKLVYFSDGCAGQYKNKKNLYNLCRHQKEFGLRAEWNFFATSHGKSPYDGLGGTIKRITVRTSLQRHKEHHILTPSDMFNFCNTTPSLSSIKFFYIPKYELAELNTAFASR